MRKFLPSCIREAVAAVVVTALGTVVAAMMGFSLLQVLVVVPILFMGVTIGLLAILGIGNCLHWALYRNVAPITADLIDTSPNGSRAPLLNAPDSEEASYRVGRLVINEPHTTPPHFNPNDAVRGWHVTMQLNPAEGGTEEDTPDADIVVEVKIEDLTNGGDIRTVRGHVLDRPNSPLALRSGSRGALSVALLYKESNGLTWVPDGNVNGQLTDTSRLPMKNVYKLVLGLYPPRGSKPLVQHAYYARKLTDYAAFELAEA